MILKEEGWAGVYKGLGSVVSCRSSGGGRDRMSDQVEDDSGPPIDHETSDQLCRPVLHLHLSH